MGDARLVICAVGAVVVAAAVAAACSDRERTAGAPATSGSTAFPRGAALERLRGSARPALRLASGATLAAGARLRFTFQVFDASGRPAPAREAAVYVTAGDGTTGGPWRARRVAFGLRPAFVSRTTAADPDADAGFWVAGARVPHDTATVTVVVRGEDGRLRPTNTVAVRRGGPQDPPGPGDPAVVVHTPTAADVAGDLGRISTRVPPARALHRDDLAAVVGRRPVVLGFATPALCSSRVCGPVVDVLAQVQSDVGRDVAFIHQEIHVANDPAEGLRPQVRAWGLTTEPWTFVLDARGRIAARFEGPVSVGELRAAIDVVRASGGDEAPGAGKAQPGSVR